MLAALENQSVPLFLSYNTSKSYNLNHNESMFLCFPDDFDFQKHSALKTTSQVNGNYALSVRYPCWPPQVVKTQFSNTCAFQKKGKEGLTNQAKHFLVLPCSKAKQNAAPPLTQSSPSQNAHSAPLHSHPSPSQTAQGIFLAHSPKLASCNSGSGNVPSARFLGAKLPSAASAVCQCQQSLPGYGSISMCVTF